MLHSEFSTRVSKPRWCSAGASWLLRALRDVSDESLLAKYLLLLLLPVTSESPASVTAFHSTIKGNSLLLYLRN